MKFSFASLHNVHVCAYTCTHVYTHTHTHNVGWYWTIWATTQCWSTGF